MKRILAIVFAGASLVAAAQPEITDLEVSQNSSRMVTISFSLSANAIVTMDITTNGVSIGAENYQTLRDPYSTKDTFPANKAVKAGKHTWVWRPSKEWPGHHFHNSEFKVLVQAWSFDSPPDYMVIDSSVRSNAMFYAKVEDIPGGIKTADPEDADAVAALKEDPYRTTKLVMRKIPAAGVKWRMGSPEDEPDRQEHETPHYVTLTNDYYVAIYPTTFTQVKKFCYSGEATSFYPKHNTKYTAIRGTTYSWPADGYLTEGFMATMRTRTGLRFDLLTEAEWEYACRAGTQGRWNHDGDSPDEVAWTDYQGKAKSHTVGLKRPNNWGLYDMHGLVNEWVLDQWGAYPTESVVAPVGPTPTTETIYRVVRGGPKAVNTGSENNKDYTKSPLISTRSAFRTSLEQESRTDGNSNGYGFRFSCPASLPEWMRD
ncbi:MAG: formylglycine-generating enzyme family protein [Kiritimatiellae bacterium]|nr:formylglycine-generating enzyme family protein [Kiritimatiellia bacterium]